jgi:2-haloacid dehalogenase
MAAPSHTGRSIGGIPESRPDRFARDITLDTGVIAFDVNETLLDLSPLDPVFDELFGDASARMQWFAQMLQVAFVGAITGRYVDFTSAQRAALDMLAQRRDVTLPADAPDRVAAAMRALPAHPDVADALSRLRAGGHQLAALSNSPLEVEEAQLAHAGLTDHFDAILSADTVRSLKPRREPYELAARTFGVPIGEVTLVAAHAWDVAGALAAGCRAAFVARAGMPRNPLDPEPDFVGSDLSEIANRLLSA